MKTCPNPDCKQQIGESVDSCPLCGAQTRPSRSMLDGYTLKTIVHETRDCTLYRANKGDDEDVLIRLYSPAVDITPDKSEAMAKAVADIQGTSNYLVQHKSFNQASTGEYYLVSEWLGSMPWGDLHGQHFFRDPLNLEIIVGLLENMVQAFATLHSAGRIFPTVTFDDLILHRVDGELRVKLDFGFSRILDPKMENPSKMRKKLMAVHPDIVEKQPLTEKSDIWTLGYLFLELLIDSDEIEDCQKALDSIYHENKPVVLHHKISGLLRSMVEDDPDKRLASMTVATESLKGLSVADYRKWRRTIADPDRKNWLIKCFAAAAIIVGLVTWGVVTYQQRTQKAETLEEISDLAHEVSDTRSQLEETGENARKGIEAVRETAEKRIQTVIAKTEDAEKRLEVLSERYSHSIAFVQVDVGLTFNGKQERLISTSGTAFLVSNDGYLLTNRHVACPWLSNQSNRGLLRKCRELRASRTPFTFYYKTYLWFEGEKALRPLYNTTRTTPTEDMFFLRTAYSTEADADKRLELVGVSPSPTTILSYLAGVQDDIAVFKIPASPDGVVPIPLHTITNGCDISRGTKVFALGFSQGRGPISGEKVVSRFSQGLVTRSFPELITTNADIQPGNSGGPIIDMNGRVIGIATQIYAGQSSMGRALPINKAVALLEAVKAGPQWKGLTEMAFEAESAKALRFARQGKWRDATNTLYSRLKDGAPSSLYFQTALYSVHDNPKRRELLEHAVRLDNANHFAKFLLFLEDWKTGKALKQCRYVDDLNSLNWAHSPYNIFSVLVQELDTSQPTTPISQFAESAEEACFVHWVRAHRRTMTKAERMSELNNAYQYLTSDWQLGFLIRQDLEALDAWTSRLPIATPFTLNKNAKNVQKAFYSAAKGLWPSAFLYTSRYQYPKNRESVYALTMNVLHGQLLRFMTKDADSDKYLREFAKKNPENWFGKVAKCLTGEVKEALLRKEAEGHIEKSLILFTALGLKAEAEEDKVKAIAYYSDAIDTCKTNWYAYNLAKARRKALRK